MVLKWTSIKNLEKYWLFDMKKTALSRHLIKSLAVYGTQNNK